MGQTVRIDGLADAVMEGLKEYAALAADGMKKEVRKAGNTAKKEIAQAAPKKTGKYAKSWRTKTTRETADAMEVTVYSPSRYQIAHLLEHGHAKRGGGRVPGRAHIGPAEDAAVRELETGIRRTLGQA